MLPQQQLDQLKGFISVIQAKPDLLHTPELSFFKVTNIWLNQQDSKMNFLKSFYLQDYLESLGANLPDAPKAKADEKTPEPEPMPEEPEPEPESEESEVELDLEGVIGKSDFLRKLLNRLNRHLQ